jgi:hypothetical protein
VAVAGSSALAVDALAVEAVAVGLAVDVLDAVASLRPSQRWQWPAPAPRRARLPGRRGGGLLGAVSLAGLDAVAS